MFLLNRIRLVLFCLLLYCQALEHSPEVFGTVEMLYVNMHVNGVPVKTFVDSGAQMTIMTYDFADKCYLTRLIDKRFQGMAVGVGSSRIVGRIHQAPLKVRMMGWQYDGSAISRKLSTHPFTHGAGGLAGLMRAGLHVCQQAVRKCFIYLLLTLWYAAGEVFCRTVICCCCAVCVLQQH